MAIQYFARAVGLNKKPTRDHVDLANACRLAVALGHHISIPPNEASIAHEMKERGLNYEDTEDFAQFLIDKSSEFDDAKRRFRNQIINVHCRPVS